MEAVVPMATVAVAAVTAAAAGASVLELGGATNVGRGWQVVTGISSSVQFSCFCRMGLNRCGGCNPRNRTRFFLPERGCRLKASRLTVHASAD